MYSLTMRKMADRGSMYALPTERDRKFVCTGFVLALFSVFAALFPICGLPIAVASIIMGLVGRRIKGLYTMATWTVALAVIGLGLALINIIVSVSFYLSMHMHVWG